jgi:para-aminobenzoate synthetase/4-amino-4-deoxychorismate lyase
VTAYALPAGAAEPWHLVVRRVPGGWGGHKWLDRRALEAWAGHADPTLDPLLVDEDDTCLETGRANLFVVAGGVLLTPPLDGRILPGTARAALLETSRTLRVAVEEVPVPLADLAEAEEVFVSNAVVGVRPVTACDGVGRWAVGPVTQELAATLERGWGGSG